MAREVNYLFSILKKGLSLALYFKFGNHQLIRFQLYIGGLKNLSTSANYPIKPSGPIDNQSQANKVITQVLLKFQHFLGRMDTWPHHVALP